MRKSRSATDKHIALMKLRKNGEPGELHRDAWRLMGMKHEEFAGALTWLASRSFSLLLGEEPSDADPQSRTVTRLMFLRVMEEGRMKSDDARKHLSLEASEIVCLLRTLMKWSAEQRKQAERCRSIAAQETRGRPRSPIAITSNTLSSLMSLGQKAKKPSGRRKLVNLDDAEIMSALENERSSRQTTDISVLRELAKRYLAQQGKHAAGGYVERVAKNLQRRAAGIRKLSLK